MAGHVSCCQVLLQAAPNLHALLMSRDAFGLTALHAAASSCHPLCCRVLLGFLPDSSKCESYDLSQDQRDDLLFAKNRQGRTALHFAALKGNAACCSELLGPSSNREAMLTEKDAMGRVAMDEASSAKSEDCCRILMEREDSQVTAAQRYTTKRRRRRHRASTEK
eukprot:gnl/MRDRNA2_/MRDRNA2_201001_c0_seq1.p1 gnl/MRDRNA2_/MRDRNA2_201001_c0~~gnl/MRDRNA2_/MRDRNA2_201001_c0_seq1.p1  ORF type:complete len:165 (-),score=21.88 gnl/MRDRNA2_/MRDRNA2_201001_c0_seq1:31-525(-)